jgi:ankyrin repeat protein
MVEQNQYAMLLKSGIVVTNREINGTSMSQGGNPMWWAVFHSNLELTRKFLEGGGDPNSADAEENTCLHVAVRNGDMQIVFLLLDYGADLNKKNAKKASCLLHASKQMLKLLGLEEGSVLGDKDNNGLFYRRTMHEDPYPEHYY